MQSTTMTQVCLALLFEPRMLALCDGLFLRLFERTYCACLHTSLSVCLTYLVACMAP